MLEQQWSVWSKYTWADLYRRVELCGENQCGLCGRQCAEIVSLVCVYVNLHVDSALVCACQPVEHGIMSAS